MLPLERCVPRSGLTLARMPEAPFDPPYPSPWRRRGVPVGSELLWRARVSEIHGAFAMFANQWPAAAALTRLSVERGHARRRLARALVFDFPVVSAEVRFSDRRLLHDGIDAILWELGSSGRLVSKTIYDVCWHEFGHVVCDIVAMAPAAGSTLHISSARNRLIDAACFRAGVSRPAAEIALSERAQGAFAGAEMLAEGFVQASSVNTTTSPFAQALLLICQEAWPQ